MMDGWHVLGVLQEILGARLTVFIACVGMAISPRAFALFCAVITSIHLLLF